MKTLWNEMWDFLKKAWFTVPVALLTAIAYGYSLTHTIINMDDLAKQYYYDGTVYFAYGRPFRWILEHVTGVIPIHPFVTGLTGLLLILLAAVCFCVVLKRASGDALIKPAYPLFACLFITYPLQFESWLCDWNCIMFGAAYLLSALAVACMEHGCRKTRPWGELSVAAALLAVTLLMYESFLLVYVCGIFFLLILRWVYGDAESRKLPRFLLKGLLCVLPLVAAYVLKSVVFPESTGLPGFDLEDRAKLLLVRWVLNGKWSFAVQIVIGAVLLSLACGVALSIKRRNASLLLLVAGFLVSPFLFDILLGSRLPLRSCQTVAVFVGFAGVLVCMCLAALTRREWIKTGC